MHQGLNNLLLQGTSAANHYDSQSGLRAAKVKPLFRWVLLLKHLGIAALGIKNIIPNLVWRNDTIGTEPELHELEMQRGGAHWLCSYGETKILLTTSIPSALNSLSPAYTSSLK